MKSELLARQLLDIFGSEGEAALRQALAELAARQPRLAGQLERLVEVADATYTQYAGLQRWQSELSGDAFSDWNLKSGNIDSGRQWKVLLGYQPVELDNTLAGWQRLLHPEDLKQVQSRIAIHVSSQEDVFQTECRMRSKAGDWKWLLVRGVVTARDPVGEPVRMLVMHRDIGEVKAAASNLVTAKEAAESSNRARGAFLANMSHEIRTPMNAIIGMTELVLDTELDAEQRHYLRTVRSSAETLLTIVDDILDFSKIEAGKMRFEAISFDPGEVVLETARTLAVSAHKRGLELIVDVAPDVPRRLVGDPTRLRQIQMNLLGNAIKFTEHGEVAVSVNLERQTAGSVYLRFAVRDTGIGIPAEKQQAIFDAFSQADASTTRRFGGTGLGLAICSRLVQLMDGHIWLESSLGEGTTFFFNARLGLAGEAGTKVVANSAFAGKRALIVGGNRAVGENLQRLFERLGGQAALVVDPVAGIDALERSRVLDFPYDFVLADGATPAPGGLALAERLSVEASREKLVVVLSTEGQRQESERLRQLGVRASLVKPVGLGDLADALALAVGEAEGEGAFELAPFAMAEGAEATQAALDVLVVEDNPVNQELARRLLERRGHRVTVANNGQEAIDHFEKQRFDVILMDMQMPVLGGMEATEAIRAREMRRSWVMSEAFKPVYIIAMTANAMAGDRDRCLEVGMNDYLAKPVRMEALDAALARVQGKDSLQSDAGKGGGEEAILGFDQAMADLGDRELLNSMAEMMLLEWDEHVSRVRGAIEQESGADLRLHAHTLKSLLAIFHAERSRRLAMDLERAAQEGVAWERCRQLWGALEVEMNRLKPELIRAMEAGG